MVMIPMAFCASFIPCEKDIQAAESICNLLKCWFSFLGAEFLKSQEMITIKNSPPRKPRMGETNIAMVIFVIPCITTILKPAATMPAPRSPPIREWETLTGMPEKLAKAVQALAPIKATKTKGKLAYSGSIIPFPIVAATAV